MHTQDLIPTGRIFMIGAGNVGATAAYALLNQDFLRELVIIDIADELAAAQEMDLAHAAAMHNGVKVRVGSYDMLRDGDLIVITSGAAQKEGQTRMDLAQTNINITNSITAEIKKRKKDVYVMLVSNPVDVLTFVASKELDYLKPGRVFGSGTTLDSARLRHLLSQKLQLNPLDIQAYVLGEHGNTSFPALSRASINGQPLSEFLEVDSKLLDELQTEVRQAAYKIISGKGSTNFGIGNAISLFAKAIFENSQKVMPASVIAADYYGLGEVALGIPALINMSGVHRFDNFTLSEPEIEKLVKSSNEIKAKLAEFGY